MITGKLYDQLKWLAQIFLPAVGTLYFALAAIWGLPAAEEVVGTIVAVDAFLGVILSISQNAYKQNPDRFDGRLIVTPDPDHPGTGMVNLDLGRQSPEDVVHKKDEVVLKVQHPPNG